MSTFKGVQPQEAEGVHSSSQVWSQMEGEHRFQEYEAYRIGPVKPMSKEKCATQEDEVMCA